MPHVKHLVEFTHVKQLEITEQFLHCLFSEFVVFWYAYVSELQSVIQSVKSLLRNGVRDDELHY